MEFEIENDEDTNHILQYLKEYEQDNQSFGKYYTSNIHSIYVRYIYINNNQCIEKMSRDLIMLRQPNLMKWTHLLQLINSNCCYNVRKYKLQFLGKYNAVSSSDSFSEIPILQDVCFQPTIRIYHDLNEIAVIFKEEMYPKSHHRTKCKNQRIIHQKNNMKCILTIRELKYKWQLFLIQTFHRILLAN